MCDYGAIFSYHDLASRAKTFDLSLSLSDQLRDDLGQDANGMPEQTRRTSATKIRSEREFDKGHIEEIILRRVARLIHQIDVLEVITSMYIEQLHDHCQRVRQYRHVFLPKNLSIATTRTRKMTARMSPS